MDILVCMKQVIDDSVPLDPAGLESASTILNPYDGYALELALRYVQKHEGSVTVLSAGGAGIEPVLYQGMACGADQAVRIGCDDNSGDFSQAIWAGICELYMKCGFRHFLPPPFPNRLDSGSSILICIGPAFLDQ